MDSIDTKSKVNSAVAIPTGGTRKSSSGSGGDDGISFASLLSGGGLAGLKSGGGMQSGLEDSLSGALDRNPDETPEKAPEQATRHDYNDDTPEQSRDDGYYNKPDNSHDNLNDNLDDTPRESVHTSAATSDHSDDYNSANDEPISSGAEHAPEENVAQESGSTNTDEPKEAQTDEAASETGTASANKGDASANANGGATVETLNELSQNQALPEQAALAASSQTKDVQGRANAVDGLNTATAAIGAEKSTKPQSVQQNGGEKANNQEKAGENLNQAVQSDGKQEKAKTASNAATNTTAKPLQDQSQQAAQTKVETQPREISNVARQAAEISRAIGGDKEVSISVSVQSEKETLISRPRAALSLAADANKANGGLNNTSTQTQQNQSTNNQMTQQNGAQNQNAQNMALVGQQAQVAGRQAAANTVNNAPSAVVSAQSTSAISGDAGSLNASSQVGESLNARQANATTKTNAPAGNPATSKQPAAEQVSVQITKAIKVGSDRISIQLRPAALGRIDVQMEMGADGRISAVITADNKETLDLLQRDSRSLERALQDSGLRTDSGSLSFNLRGQNDRSAGDALAENNAGAQGNIEDEEEPLDALLSSEFKQNNKAIDDGRIDIHA